MRVYRGLPAAADRALALAIGNFDGVHLGHQAMLRRVLEAAEDLGLVPAALTFQPHPREFFAPQSAPPRLSTLRDKVGQIGALGMERLYVARFDRAFAGLSAEAFVDDVLLRRLGTRWVLVGDDFRFGRGRTGDLALLRAASERSNFSVEAMATVSVEDERVSSTAVRDALAAGELAHAARLLGRPYTIGGRIVHGDKLGRTLGFPTANVPLRYRPPLCGVFAARVHGLGAEPLAGAASLGVRPTVKAGAQPLLEVFIFDFAGDIYGRRIAVELVHKLRDEERYDTLERLTRQIHADVAQAKAFFATRS
jgi:riboflavin kinase/FMN adenylyltransferase